ncbi:MAG TPA: acyl-CoA dehydratase activase, partial [bacterium]|nr:acyl-CoA dehydratase activase [bacterium]
MKGPEVCKELLFDTADFYRSFRPADPVSGRFDVAGFGIAPDVVVTTGYGRNALPFTGRHVMTEIQAHVRGAAFLSGLKTFLLVDIGGQDVKVVKVADGAVAGFRVNDKCAAGTGRYLENMRRVLGVSAEELGAADGEPCQLNATCAVFTETEIVDKIASGVSIGALCAGVNYSAYAKFKSHILDLWSGEPVLLTGGGAKNEGIRRLIAGEISPGVRALDRCQFGGAIGCALHGG